MARSNIIVGTYKQAQQDTSRERLVVNISCYNHRSYYI